jgi:hypothetical protein
MINNKEKKKRKKTYGKFVIRAEIATHVNHQANIERDRTLRYHSKCFFWLLLLNKEKKRTEKTEKKKGRVKSEREERKRVRNDLILNEQAIQLTRDAQNEANFWELIQNPIKNMLKNKKKNI